VRLSWAPALTYGNAWDEDDEAAVQAAIQHVHDQHISL